MSWRAGRLLFIAVVVVVDGVYGELIVAVGVGERARMLRAFVCLE